MAQLFADQDVATLRAMAYAAGVPDTDQKSHQELVAELRRAGLAEPTGPVDTSLSDPGDPGTDEGVYHGRGVGRRESLGGPAAETSTRERPTPAGEATGLDG